MRKSLDHDKNEQYGFHHRLREEFPSQIIVDATEVCNLACIHCSHPQFRHSDHYKASQLERELNEKMVSEVRLHGQGITQYIRYASSGETLLHPNICEMVEYACRNSGTMISLTTNGTVMTERMINRLIVAGVDVVDISIDAFTEETYAKVRVNGNLTLTRSNVVNLIKLSRNSSCRTKVVVSFIEQPLNSHEKVDFDRYWTDQGADYVIIRRLHSNAGSNPEVAARMKNGNISLKRRPCLYPWERIVLNPRGWLSYCPADWTHQAALQDYRLATIKETWTGKLYQGLREAHLQNDFSQFSFCGQCPDWAATRWPFDGRSFADMIEDFQKEREDAKITNPYNQPD